jgi:hypothetical protein
MASQWFSVGIPVSSTNKTDRHNIAEIWSIHSCQKVVVGGTNRGI